MANENDASGPFRFNEFTVSILKTNEGAAAAGWMTTQFATFFIQKANLINVAHKDIVYVSILIVAILIIKFTFRKDRSNEQPAGSKPQVLFLSFLNGLLCLTTAMGFQYTIAIISPATIPSQPDTSLHPENLSVHFIHGHKANLLFFIDTDPWLLTNRVNKEIKGRDLIINDLMKKNADLREQLDSSGIKSTDLIVAVPNHKDSLLLAKCKAQNKSLLAIIDSLKNLTHKPVPAKNDCKIFQDSLSQCQAMSDKQSQTIRELQAKIGKCEKALNAKGTCDSLPDALYKLYDYYKSQAESYRKEKWYGQLEGFYYSFYKTNGEFLPWYKLHSKH